MTRGGDTVTCACCYCQARQEVPTPPALHRCAYCGLDFRVLWKFNRKAPIIDMSVEARRHFEKRRAVQS